MKYLPVQKGMFSVKNVKCRVKGLVLGAKPPHIKLCLVASPAITI